MRTKLMRLSPADAASLRVLFVARFAPHPGASEPGLHPDHGVFPRYNFEMHERLSSLVQHVTACDDLDRLTSLAGEHDYVFTLYNRAPFRNCELYVSLMCERLGVPYLGAPPNIRALAEDKFLSKALARSLGIPVVPGKAYGDESELETPVDVPGPYFVKPRFGAASETVSVDSVCHSWERARERAREMLAGGRECLVERCIAGSDLTVPVLGGDPPMILPCAEEISELPYGIATYRQKRLLDKGRSRRRLEDQGLERRLDAYVRTLCAHARPFDYLRADFRLDAESGKPYFLEFNLACNIGSHAAVAFSAREVGIEHEPLVEHMLAYSLARQRRMGRWRMGR